MSFLSEIVIVKASLQGKGVLFQPVQQRQIQAQACVRVLGRKFMSCSHVKSWVNLLTWLLIGCSLLCSQSGASTAH